MQRVRIYIKVTLLMIVTSLISACSSDQGSGNSIILINPNDIEMYANSLKAKVKPQTNADGNYNIIFITVDQEHYFEQYPLGTSFKARQLLEKLGTTFEKHYISSNVSTSSRSTIYTGTHVTNTKMLDNTDFPWQPAIADTITTVGDMMRSAGYYTAYKGKFHMGGIGAEPTQNELEKYGFADFNPDGDYEGHALQGFSSDPKVTGGAVSWLRKTGIAQNNLGKSFFLAVNYVNPHDIMYYNTDKDEKVQANGLPDNSIMKAPDTADFRKTYPFSPVPATWNDNLTANGRVPAHYEFIRSTAKKVGFIPAELWRWESFRDFYYNSIQENDHQLLELLQQLIDLDMLDNSIIVFTSDHGEMQGANGMHGKGGFIYDNNIHVPLVMYHPEHLIKRRVKAVTSHLDLATTFVAMTNVDDARKSQITARLQGANLMTLVKSEVYKVREGALFAFEMFSTVDQDMVFVRDPVTEKITGANLDLNKRGFVRGITNERYKFARYFSPLKFNTPTTIDELYTDNDVELYDTLLDPYERNNLAANSAGNAELIMTMNSALNTLIAKEIGIDDGAETLNILHYFNQ